MKSIFKTLFIKCICICLLLAITVGGCSMNNLNTESVKIVLRCAESLPKDHPTTQAAYHFSKLVSEKTGGRILIEINYDETLGTPKEVIEQVKLGGIDFARVDSSDLEELVPEFSVLQLPYIFGDSKHMWKVLDGQIGNNLISLLSDKGIEGVAWLDGGVMGFYTDVPLKSLQELKSLRIRTKTTNSSTHQLLRGYGAVPVVLDFSKTASALNNGSIDGAEDNLTTYYLLEHYKSAKNYLIDNHCFNSEIMIMSPMLKDELSQSDYEIVVDCAKQAALYQRELWSEFYDEALENLQKQGIKINYIESEDLFEYRDAIMKIYQDNLGDFEQLVYEIRLERLT